jgi:subtilisin family serine protease
MIPGTRARTVHANLYSVLYGIFTSTLHGTRRRALRGTGALVLGLLLGLTPMAARAVQPPAGPDSLSEADLLKAYLPKADLGVDRFLAQHPQADGRGVLVAILDTGVDLNHPGLLRTPSGERKIVDVFDATDNGLLDLPLILQTADSVLTGLTGRTLHLGRFRSDDGNYRLGRLSAREIFPPGLVGRLLQERRRDRERRIAAWENEVAVEEGVLGKKREVKEDSIAPPDRARLYRETRRAADREYDDPGPVYDLVAFRSKGEWRLLIDTRQDGDLGGQTPLAPYRAHGDIALFPPPASLSMALAWIEQDGSRISLFFDEGGHGTHVAGIVGAYYGPDDPLNGLAPGVRFLAVKVGNGRLGGTTSHNSVIKAADWAVAHGAMVANLSFGGGSHFQNGEEIGSRFLDELIQNHGLFLSVSAGNEGPGLSTVGSPGTARRAFTMGAAISPRTILASYGGLQGAPGPGAPALQLFNFSSRGPLADGSPGVDFVSPGAAVSTLPTWLLTRNENWNGTSMAAPQAAGCLALLISGCMEEGIPISPPRMDRAMRAAAVPLAGVSYVEQGAGAIRVPETFEVLRALAKTFPVSLPAQDPRAETAASVIDSVQVPGIGVPATRDPVTFWRIRTDNATGAGGGYYERDLMAEQPYWKSFQVSPDLPPKGANPLRDTFQRVVRLQSTVPWMEAPPQMAIPASGVSIRVKIDPSKMEPGLNVGRIRLWDVATAGPGGALAPASAAPGTETELLATLIKPERCAPPDYRIERTIDLSAGERRGLFLEVPAGATRLRLRLSEELANPANTYSLAATALSLLHSPSALRSGTRLDLRQGQESVLYQRVEPGATVELALFARWTNPGRGRLRLTAEFDGLQGPSGLGSTARLGGEQGDDARWGERPILVYPGRHGAVVPVQAPLKSVSVSASARITGKVEPLEIEWDLRPDSLYTKPLEGEHALIMRGRGRLQLDANETVTIDLHDGPELEDFLDDSFYRLYDPNDHLAGAGNISNGPFTVHAPAHGPSGGWYRIEFSIFALGRAFVQDWSMFSPEVIRGASGGRLMLFPDPVEGLSAAPDSSWGVNLLRGAQRPLYLAVKGLAEGSVYTGDISFRDQAEVPPLLRVPLRVDTRKEPVGAEEEMLAAVARLERHAREARTLPPPSSLSCLGDLDRAESLLRTWKGNDYDTSREGWDRLFLRVDLWLRQGEGPQVVQEVDRLLQEAERRSAEEAQKEKDRLKQAEKDGRSMEGRAHQGNEGKPGAPAAPSEAADRADRGRRHQGEILFRRARLELRRGELQAARRFLTQSAVLDFGGENPDEAESELLQREGRSLDAVPVIRRASRADPFNPSLARREIEAYLALGWRDLADERLEDWPDRFPKARETYFDLLKAAGETKPAGEARRAP